MTGGGSGRPLRFLLLVIGGWTGARLWCLWPVAPMPAVNPAPVRPMATRSAIPLAAAGSAQADDAPTLAAPWRRDGARPVVARAYRPAEGPATASASAAPPGTVASTRPSTLRFGDPVPEPSRPSIALPARQASRLSGSAWLLARGGPALAGGLAGAQLGGSQAGVRLAFAVDRARRLAIVGRLTTAIGGSGAGRFLSDREGAVGLAWRPTRLPVTLVAEQRFVFDRGGHGGPTIGVIAGLPPTEIAAGFRLESYGQAGAIARAGAGNGVEAFGDGAARLTRLVTLGPLRLDLGAGAWGGAQRGASRLDVGPTLGASVPVAGHGLRLTVDWRARIAGDARPGSGPALSLGTDF